MHLFNITDKLAVILIIIVFTALLLFTVSACSPQLDITKIPLNDVINNGKPTLADFAGTDCKPCKLMKPILEELEKEYRGKINVVIVEYSHNPKLTDKYAVSVIPTQILFDAQGNELVRHKGFWSKEEMILELKKLTTE